MRVPQSHLGLVVAHPLVRDRTDLGPQVYGRLAVYHDDHQDIVVMGLGVTGPWSVKYQQGAVRF